MKLIIAVNIKIVCLIILSIIGEICNPVQWCGENVNEEESSSNNQNNTVDGLALLDCKKDQLTVESDFSNNDKGSGECQTTKHPRDTKAGAGSYCS